MDWWMYRKEVLHKRLYPFVQHIKETGRNMMWLYEDNVGNHTKAARIDQEEADLNGVHHCNAPPNSPDYNMSEQAWRYIKDIMPTHYSNLLGSSSAVLEKVKQLLIEKWYCIPQDLIDRWCDNFHCNLRLSLE
ncbi:hypothetical protein L873DRAFT_546366 [Choiromyces venosus 120613-1]|uniref:Tc1-like transposase DDE domain-containing protein n=1 Tax=Choiromyces venosus 120613-1 TaxID=1336337 RepID=A0A3N4K8M0_9PEZI|nr:hypothetical protein L873DRAFT_546366 [Choiromyces venosus 120613-1]